MALEDPYPLNLIIDACKLDKYTDNIVLSPNATEIVDKCLEKIGNDSYFTSAQFVLTERYKRRRIIKDIADDIERSRAVTYARIERAIDGLRQDKDFYTAFATTKADI